MLQKNNEFKIKSVDLKKYVKTTHYKCGVFLPKWDNKRGESLSMHLPFEFDYVKSCLIFVIIIMPLIINIFHPDRVTGNIVLFIFLGLPMSYFIKNNIPVSAFFNAKAWDYYEVLFTPNDKKVSHTPSSSSDFYRKMHHSPSRSYLLSNIYHRKR